MVDIIEHYQWLCRQRESLEEQLESYSDSVAILHGHLAFADDADEIEDLEEEIEAEKVEISDIEDSLWEIKEEIKFLVEEYEEVAALVQQEEQDAKAHKRARRRLKHAYGRIPQSIKGFRWWEVPLYPPKEGARQ